MGGGSRKLSRECSTRVGESPLSLFPSFFCFFVLPNLFIFLSCRPSQSLIDALTGLLTTEIIVDPRTA